MKQISESSTMHLEPMALLSPSSAPLSLPTVIGEEANHQLQRMFRDPRVLEEHECLDLIAHLRRAVDLAPSVPEVRVLLGMALSVNIEAQEAMEVLREAVEVAPDSFIAHLKFGELLMRLRICNQAAEQTHCAAQLASNPVQSDLARKQAATIRTMMREGIERGGHKGLLSHLIGTRRKARGTGNAPVLLGSK